MKPDDRTPPAREQLLPHAAVPEALLAELAGSMRGLDHGEASSRLLRDGPNTLPEPEAPGVLLIFIRQFASPLIYILLVAAVVSIALDEWSDALFIFAVLLLNAVIGTIQEYHAHKSAEALRRMVGNHAMVLRGGESFEIDAARLVVGDIVLLEGGVKVPADIRLTDSYNLEIDESLLTGESVPVGKDAKTLLEEETGIADQVNMAFSGSIVDRGKGRGIVIATGKNTVLGRLAQALGREEAKPPLLLRMEQFTVNIAIALGVVVLILAGVELMQGVAWREIFMVSVALAVSAIPEGLPVALTVALAIGMNLMARRNVIVRRLVAVESLGSCTVIASDKTGTLTLNRLTAVRLAIPEEESWEITGEGMEPEGRIVTPNGMPDDDEEAMLRRLFYPAVLCNEGFLGRRDGEWASHGDTVDVALLVMGHKVGLTQGECQNRYPLISQIPYESQLGFSASLHDSDEGQHIFVKGAMERLLPMCSRMMTRQGNRKLDEAAIQRQVEALAALGYRVLAFATGNCEIDDPADFGIGQLHDLTFLGLVGMIDPLRPEAKEAVAACRRAGIRACMITGDHPVTAFAIAREIELADSPEQVVTGNDIREAVAESEERLDAITRRANVFARVEPEQKLAIVQSLQRGGHFVAVTGDGANDAPALNAAHVGVAMGERGTDVARESASLIITDDNFASIVAGVEEGRIAYRNIRKVIFLLISTGAAELVLFILSLAFALPLPLYAVQLLWLNLVTNGIQDVALAFEKAEGNEMLHPPRRPHEPIFDRLMLERTLISALYIGLLAFVIFDFLIQLGWEVELARNSALLLMVLFENVHVFNSRSETRSAFRHNPLDNKLLLFGTLIAQAIHIGAMYTPGLSDILHLHPITLSHWLTLLPVALGLLLVMELHKLSWQRRHRPAA